MERRSFNEVDPAAFATAMRMLADMVERGEVWVKGLQVAIGDGSVEMVTAIGGMTPEIKTVYTINGPIAMQSRGTENATGFFNALMGKISPATFQRPPAMPQWAARSPPSPPNEILFAIKVVPDAYPNADGFWLYNLAPSPFEDSSKPSPFEDSSKWNERVQIFCPDGWHVASISQQAARQPVLYRTSGNGKNNPLPLPLGWVPGVSMREPKPPKPPKLELPEGCRDLDLDQP